MPLVIKKTKPPLITLEFDWNFKDAHLSEMDGPAFYKGHTYHAILGRKGVDGNYYGYLEVQQLDHAEDQVEEVELYDDGYTYPLVPLPKELHTLIGDTIIVGPTFAQLRVSVVKPWVFPDAEGIWPDDKSYSILALNAKLTTEQTDELFALGGVSSWAKVLRDQEKL